MKLSREFINGCIIFLGIGIYFIILDLLHLSDIFWLRIFNVIFVVYGVNRTIAANHADGIRGYNKNFLSAVITSMIGAALSIAGLMVFLEFKGGEAYLKTLSEDFIFGGGQTSVLKYCIGLLFESTAASLMVSFSLMQYWKNKVEDINKIDPR